MTLLDPRVHSKRTTRRGAVGPASPASADTRRMKLAAAGAILVVLLFGLLVLRSGGRDEQPSQPSAPTVSAAGEGTEQIPVEAQPVLSAGPLEPSPPLPPPPAEPGASGPCPAVRPHSGSPCAVAAGEALICGYPGEAGAVTCNCQAAADVPATWSCVADRDQPRLAKCPSDRPDTGAECSPAGISCIYAPGPNGTGCTCKPGGAVSTWSCMPYFEFFAK